MGLARKDGRLAAAQRVLVVDGLMETEEVLRAVLEPRGLEVDRVRGPRFGNFPAKERPSVVVLHLDDAQPFARRAAEWPNVPRIVIGAAQPAVDAGANADERFLEKPFHYGELIRAIEVLLTAVEG